jgi:16S rRNA (adenine1518-N6/adenine1519-N6)-dimethyltransferase
VPEEPNLPPLREVIARHRLSARKSYGQHFLLDLNLTRRIARAAGDLGQGTTIEVGPGPGGLTRALLAEGAARVVAIERDERCLAAVEELGVTVDVADLGEAPRRIVANLPYNVATALLVRWLTALAEAPGCLSYMVLMFQKEVAERLAAPAGNRTYGRLSVLAQWLCRVRPLFDVPARAFTPPPKVVSTVVGLEPLPAPAQEARLADLERVTAAAFGQRRKMLRQSLKSLGGEPRDLLDAAGIDETARAEALAVADFCALARALRARAET